MSAEAAGADPEPTDAAAGGRDTDGMAAPVVAIVPTLGQRLDTLEEALGSIATQRVRVRIVVVAPREAPGLAEVVERWGGELVEDPGSGLSAAMNAGLRAAAGERWYLWLNDDDLLRPGGLAVLLELAQAHPDAPVVYGGCDYIDPQGRRFGANRAGRLAAFVLPWGPDLVPMPASLTSVEAARAAGGYDEALRYAMDFDLLLRLRRQGPFAATRQVVAAFRWHPTSLTVANRRASVREAEAVKRRYLPRMLRPVSWVWHLPVRAATFAAAWVVQRRAVRAGSAAAAG